MQLSILRQHLIETLHQPDLLHQYIDFLAYQNYPPLPVCLPGQMGNDLFPNGFITQFVWSPLHPISVKTIDKEHYQVQIGAKKIDLKGVPSALVDNLFSHAQFSLSDIADWAPQLDFEGDIAPVIARFVAEGVLQIKPVE